MKTYEFRTVMDGKRELRQYREVREAVSGEKDYGEWQNVVRELDQERKPANYRCPDTPDMFPNDGDVK